MCCVLQDKASALRLLQVIDTSNGYAFTNTAKEYAERGQHAQAGSHANSASDHNGGYSMFNVVNTQDTQPPHDLEQQSVPHPQHPRSPVAHPPRSDFRPCR